jgi:nicotinate-nucleotide adenylyltransferase
MEFLPIPGLDISSTDIRQRVAESRPVKYLLPLEVEQYILDQGLYR